MKNTAHSDALYELLRNVQIFATDKTFHELILSQDGSPHKAQGGSMSMHIHEEGSNLKVYLPREEASQQHAFSKHLPERILQWLMTDGGSQFQHQMSLEAVLAVKDIWNTPLKKVPTTLDECGIIAGSTHNRDAYPDELPSEMDSDDDDGLEVVDTPAPAQGTMRQSSSDNYSGSHPSESFTPDSTENESHALPVRLAAQSRPATPLEELPTRDTHYVRVLGRVITSARTSTIPDRNENQPDTIWRGSSNIHGSDQFERDCKIGAAGELFVGHFVPLDCSSSPI